MFNMTIIKRGYVFYKNAYILINVESNNKIRQETFI